MGKPKPTEQPVVKVGDTVEVLWDGVSWGRGMITRVLTVNGRVTGYVVRREAGTNMVVSPNQVRKTTSRGA